MSEKVEDALDDVIRWVTVGVQPLTISESTAAALKDEWRPDFEEQLDGNGINWSDVSETVNDLAKVVGAYARVLTLGHWSLTGGVLPTEVPAAAAKLSGYMVATNSPDCIERAGLTARGKFCKGFHNPAGEQRADELDNRIREIPLLPKPASNPITNARRGAA